MQSKSKFMGTIAIKRIIAVVLVIISAILILTMVSDSSIHGNWRFSAPNLTVEENGAIYTFNKDGSGAISYYDEAPLMGITSRVGTLLKKPEGMKFFESIKARFAAPFRKNPDPTKVTSFTYTINNGKLILDFATSGAAPAADATAPAADATAPATDATAPATDAHTTGRVAYNTTKFLNNIALDDHRNLICVNHYTPLLKILTLIIFAFVLIWCIEDDFNAFLRYQSRVRKGVSANIKRIIAGVLVLVFVAVFLTTLPSIRLPGKWEVGNNAEHYEFKRDGTGTHIINDIEGNLISEETFTYEHSQKPGLFVPIFPHASTENLPEGTTNATKILTILKSVVKDTGALIKVAVPELGGDLGNVCVKLVPALIAKVPEMFGGAISASEAELKDFKAGTYDNEATKKLTSSTNITKTKLFGAYFGELTSDFGRHINAWINFLPDTVFVELMQGDININYDNENVQDAAFKTSFILNKLNLSYMEYDEEKQADVVVTKSASSKIALSPALRVVVALLALALAYYFITDDRIAAKRRREDRKTLKKAKKAEKARSK